MQIDYIVVGSGLAGINFCEQLRINGKPFVVFDNSSQKSSMVAGGLYNPVVLKRFIGVWKAKEQLNMALPVYQALENLLEVKLDYKIPVYRKFASAEEQNNWFTASDKPLLSEYLSETIIKNGNKGIDAPFGFGEVLKTGRIDTKTLIEKYREFLKSEHLLREISFEYDQLQAEGNEIKYKDISAKHIVFAEGFGIRQNPLFNHLPLVPAKGELIIIHAPELNIDFVLKSAVFLIPIGNDKYIVGATYQWRDLSNKTSNKAREELLEKLSKLISCPFEVINQVAGVRPTVKDRRPLIGRHPTIENTFVLNGLGTRGVMIAPYVAQQLYNYIEHKVPLDKEINIDRFL